MLEHAEHAKMRTNTDSPNGIRIRDPGVRSTQDSGGFQMSDRWDLPPYN
jgi:hypothetical protein